MHSISSLSPPTAAMVDELLRRPPSLVLALPEADVLTAYLAVAPDPPQLVNILAHLGRTNDPRHAPLVARYLDYAQDPMAAAAALNTLCGDFGLIEDYRTALQQALRGYAWDETHDVRKRAAALAGEYLAGKKDPWLAMRLVEIAQAPMGDFAFEDLRATALLAAVRAAKCSAQQPLRRHRWVYASAKAALLCRIPCQAGGAAADGVMPTTSSPPPEIP